MTLRVGNLKFASSLGQFKVFSRAFHHKSVLEGICWISPLRTLFIWWFFCVIFLLPNKIILHNNNLRGRSDGGAMMVISFTSILSAFFLLA
jgi:hypothetical protein